MTEFKPLAGCPLCEADLVVNETRQNSASFTRYWSFEVLLACPNCGGTVLASTERSGAPAVVKYFVDRENVAKRQRDIKALHERIIELVKDDPFDALALQEARAELLRLTEQSA